MDKINSNINFTAKLNFPNCGNKWKRIAKEFEEQTQKSYPNDIINIIRHDNGISLSTNRGINHIDASLDEQNLKELNALPNKKIAKTLKKLLDFIKYKEILEVKTQRLRNKYIQLFENTSSTVEKNLWLDNSKAILNEVKAKAHNDKFWGKTNKLFIYEE